MTCVAEKVTSLIVRETAAGSQVLLFRHPAAGIQIPAGTVEEGEPVAAAALREGQEESGLADLRIIRCLGIHEVTLPADQALLRTTCTVYSRPDLSSWDWAHVQRGSLVHVLRSTDGWIQIDFRETDRFPDPEYFTFRVIGWVTADMICRTLRRHFYLLTPTQRTPDAEWTVEIDYHVFRPFWAPLDEALVSGGGVIEPQRSWLNYLRGTSDEAPLQSGSSHPLS
jgi:8-oxo-dGTP pyrophosphatase MutT (NUDIX family)